MTTRGHIRSSQSERVPHSSRIKRSHPQVSTAMHTGRQKISPLQQSTARCRRVLRITKTQPEPWEKFDGNVPAVKYEHLRRQKRRLGIDCWRAAMKIRGTTGEIEAYNHEDHSVSSRNDHEAEIKRAASSTNTAHRAEALLGSDGKTKIVHVAVHTIPDRDGGT